MSHLDAALLHEYLDRGAVDDRLQAVSRHVDACDVCTRLLHTVEAERTEASTILRAAVPLQRPMPLFETLVQRPKFETFDGGVPSDISLTTASGQFKQSSIGLRGQAVMLAWAATVVLALGAGWFANAMYRQGAARNAPAVAAAPRANAVAPDSNASTAASNGTTPESNAVAISEPTRTSASRGGRNAQAAERGPTPEPALAQSASAQSASAPAASAPSAVRDQASARSMEGVTAAPAAPPPPPAATGSASSAREVIADQNRWATVNADSAAKLLGGSIVVVEGAAILDYAFDGASSAGTSARVRVRQVTASQDTLEVWQATAPSGSRKLRADPLQRAPMIADAPSNGELNAGTPNARFYHTMLWPDGRTVTVIARDAKRAQAVKLEAIGPRK